MMKSMEVAEGTFSKARVAWFVQSASGQLILRENESMPGRGIHYRGGAHPENAERPRPSRMAGRNAAVLS